MRSKERFYYLDILKIIACLCVIMNHAIELIKEYANHSFSGALFYSVNYSIYKVAVPIFIMITGVLLLGREDSYRDMLKKIFRIMVPLLLLSLYLYIKENTLAKFSMLSFLKTFLKDPIRVPYWYLYMLIPLYLMTPFIQKMIKNFKKQDVIYFLLVVLLIPSLLNILSVYCSIQISNSFYMAWFPLYIGYYVMGYYLNQGALNKNYLLVSIGVYVISSFCFGLSMFLPFYQGGELSFALDNTSNILVVLSSLSFFYIIRYIMSKIKLNRGMSFLISKVAGTTFGIYLIHFLVYYMVYYRITFVFDYSQELGILLTVLLTFISCSIVTFIAKLLPGVKRFL